MWLNKPRSVSRLVRLLAHLAQRSVQVEKPPAPVATVFSRLVCLSFTSDTFDLTIENAVEHGDAFTQSETLQSALLHANNDCADLATFLLERYPALVCSVYGHVPVSLVNEAVRSSADVGQGMIVFWSGHGSKPNASLCCARDEYSVEKDHVPLDRIFTAVGSRPLLLILECCHSGAAVRQASSHANVMVMASTGDGVSGGWVLDGTDSGGIMTRWLVDPIGTFFKARWNIFCELSAVDRRRLYDEYRKAAETALEATLSTYWVEKLRGYGSHIWDLWIHYAGHVRYASYLHRPQQPASVPSTAGIAECSVWTDWERRMEELVREMYIQKLCEATEESG